MKKWCKLSFAGLVVPVIASVGLICARCGTDNVVQTKLSLPALIASPKVTNKALTPTAWWNSVQGILNQIAQVNELLTSETKLPADSQSIASITVKDNDKTFTFTVTLNDNYSFSNNQKVWTSDPITYESIPDQQKVIPLPKMVSSDKLIVAGVKGYNDVNAWKVNVFDRANPKSKIRPS